ncbi:MAG: tetratricopeptide repeat protein [Pyrinomonadaceae bacterium]
MTRFTAQFNKLFLTLIFAASLGIASGVVVSAQPAAVAQPQQPKAKKKLPSGAKGFAQFAGRDASDKLITGGGTRDADPNKPEADVLYTEASQKGSEHYDKGEFKEAVEAFKQAVAAKPDQFLGHYNLGVTYEAMGMFKDAAESYKRAVTLKAENASDEMLAWYNLGNTYAAAGQHKEAVEIYQQIIRREPRYWMVHYNMGVSYATLNQPKDAISAFNESIRLKPSRDLDLLHYNLGLAYSSDEQYEKAAESFKQALMIKPDYAEARYNLGLVYYVLDNQSALIEQHKILQAQKPEMASELAKLIGK